MVLMAILVFFAASAGSWFWIVRNRGSFNLLFANLTGALASLIIGIVLLMFLAPDETKAQGPAYFLYSFMAIIGAFVGTWRFVSGRFKPQEYPVARHVIAGLCSLVAASIALVVWALIFPAK
jgi:hypothetical protein